MISVIVRTGTGVEKTLSSINSQTYSEIETIAVDVRNDGLRQARGEFVAFVRAGDVLPPDALQQQVDFLSRHPGISTVLMDHRDSSKTSYFHSCAHIRRALVIDDPSLSPMLAWQQLELSELALTSDGAAKILCCADFGGAAVFRRSLFERIKPLDESLGSSAELDLVYRAGCKGGLGLINQIGLHRHIAPQSPEHVLRAKISARAKLMQLVDHIEHPDRYAALKRSLAVLHLDLADYLMRDRRAGGRHIAAAIDLDYHGLRTWWTLVRYAGAKLRLA